jgi:hypothetical protein
VIFIESKIGAVADKSQLQRYCEQLAATASVQSRVLVFITRNYELLDFTPSVLVRFIKLQWADFYRFLRARNPSSDLVRQLFKFMQENNMATSNRFSAIELLALTNHHGARTLMDATIERVRNLLPKNSGGKDTAVRS